MCRVRTPLTTPTHLYRSVRCVAPLRVHRRSASRTIYGSQGLSRRYSLTSCWRSCPGLWGSRSRETTHQTPPEGTRTHPTPSPTPPVHPEHIDRGVWVLSSQSCVTSSGKIGPQLHKIDFEPSLTGNCSPDGCSVSVRRSPPAGHHPGECRHRSSTPDRRRGSPDTATRSRLADVRGP
jgi:hypothetical protein